MSTSGKFSWRTHIDALRARLIAEAEAELLCIRDISGPTGTRTSSAADRAMARNDVREAVIEQLESIIRAEPERRR